MKDCYFQFNFASYGLFNGASLCLAPAYQEKLVGSIFTQKGDQPLNPLVIDEVVPWLFISQANIEIKFGTVVFTVLACVIEAQRAQLGQALGETADRFSCVTKQHPACAVPVSEVSNQLGPCGLGELFALGQFRVHLGKDSICGGKLPQF